MRLFPTKKGINGFDIKKALVGMFLHIVLHFQTLKLSQAECKIALHSKNKIMQKIIFPCGVVKI